MHPVITKMMVAKIKERHDQGDCPTTPAYSVENLEFAVLDLASRLALDRSRPEHTLYKTGDADAPEQIKDRNGDIVLQKCRVCGRAESDLGDPCSVVARSPGPAVGAREAEGALNWLYGEASALLNRQEHPDAEAYAPLRSALRHASDLLGLKSPISGDGSSGYEIAMKRQKAITALASYQQADEDGVMVLVSRQAVDQVLEQLRSPVPAPEREAGEDEDDFIRDDPMFNKGVEHVVDMLVRELAVTNWTAGDGSEDYDTDLWHTIQSILAAKGLYDEDEGKWATIPDDSPEASNARLKEIAIEYLAHRGENPRRILTGGQELWETHVPALRAALAQPATAGETVPVVAEALRNCGCPSDRRMTVGECVDRGTCGCSVGASPKLAKERG